MDWLFNKFFVFCSLLFLLLSSVSFADSYQDFLKAKGQLGAQKISPLYLAIDQKERQLGLMNVTKLGTDEGVLFVFEDEEFRNFWMKNTFIPLSIGFFDSKGCLQEFFDMKPVASVMQTNIPQYQSHQPARFALEMNKGWFKAHHLHPGLSLQVRLSPHELSGLSPQVKKELKSLMHPSKCKPVKANKGT